MVTQAISLTIQEWERARSVSGKANGDVTTSGDPVTVVVTPLSFRTLERRSGDTMINDFIRHITFSAVETRRLPNMDVFAYIACEERVSSNTCQIFGVPLGLGQHLRVALKTMVRRNDGQALAGNPFTAMHGSQREVPSGAVLTKQIHRGDLTPVKVIGAGQYGEVYLAVQTARLPPNLVRRHLLSQRVSEYEWGPTCVC